MVLIKIINFSIVYPFTARIVLDVLAVFIVFFALIGRSATIDRPVPNVPLALSALNNLSVLVFLSVQHNVNVCSYCFAGAFFLSLLLARVSFFALIAFAFMSPATISA